MYYNVTCSGREVNGYYGEGASNCYTDCPGSPLYPFGHGLSYTKFEYSAPECDKAEIDYESLMAGEKLTVSVRVKNVGERSGKEVVQLYIRDPKASVMRPLRELKSFKKVEISAGEEKVITFELGAESLGFYKPSGSYVVERGAFEIYVGASSIDTQKTRIKVK